MSLSIDASMVMLFENIMSELPSSFYQHIWQWQCLSVFLFCTIYFRKKAEWNLGALLSGFEKGLMINEFRECSCGSCGWVLLLACLLLSLISICHSFPSQEIFWGNIIIHPISMGINQSVSFKFQFVLLRSSCFKNNQSSPSVWFGC